MVLGPPPFPLDTAWSWDPPFSWRQRGPGTPPPYVSGSAVRGLWGAEKTSGNSYGLSVLEAAKGTRPGHVGDVPAWHP